MKLHKIEVCPRVNLWVNDRGFRFAHSVILETDILPEHLREWNEWKLYWPLYRQDNIIRKVETFLDSLPENFRPRPMFQSLNFQE